MINAKNCGLHENFIITQIFQSDAHNYVIFLNNNIYYIIMFVNVSFVYFWDNFDINNNHVLALLKKNNIDYNVTHANADILIVGSFCRSQSDYDYINNYNGRKILYITEPIDFFYPKTYELFINNKFDLVFGYINDVNIKCCKYPYYANDYIHCYNKNLMNDINKLVKNTCLGSKKFCTIINSHDQYNTRTEMFNELQNIQQVDSPGKFMNNMSNSYLNDVGNVVFIGNYLFNLCPENTKCAFDGYMTEKLLNCCLSGAIPIYFGSFDEIDEQVFNKQRIIFFNPYDKKNIVEVGAIITSLMNDKNKLAQFYTQDVFMDGAMDVIDKFEKKFISSFKKLYENILP